jgi:hypothetical protein
MMNPRAPQPIRGICYHDEPFVAGMDLHVSHAGFSSPPEMAGCLAVPGHFSGERLNF